MTPDRDYVEFSFEETGDPRNSAIEVQVPRDLDLELGAPGKIALDAPLVWAWRNPQREPRDLVHTVSGATLFSPRVQEILDAQLGPDDEVQWLPAELVLTDGTSAPHWIAHLPVHHDVLSDDGTDWQPNGVAMRYAYSRAKLAGHHLTAHVSRPARVTVPTVGIVELGTQRGTSAYVLAAEVATALRDAGITGARIVPAPLLP